MRSAERTDSSKFDESSHRVSLFSDLYISAIGRDFENEAIAEGYKFIAGVDEVGRGCLAGAVVAAACILDVSRALPDGLDDSKKLTAEQREAIAVELKETAVAYAVGQVEADEIDRINILQATKKAMCEAIATLKPSADFLLIDAIRLKEIPLPQKAIIKGDTISASIAAASILAKTYRDDLMREMCKIYPEYGFSKHVGYGTKAHIEAIKKYGTCPLHRKSFHGVV